MDERIEDSIRRFIAGALSLAEAKVLILAEFPGCRRQHQTLLLADYIEDLLFRVRGERMSAAAAARDLAEVRALERL